MFDVRQKQTTKEAYIWEDIATPCFMLTEYTQSDICKCEVGINGLQTNSTKLGRSEV